MRYRKLSCRLHWCIRASWINVFEVKKLQKIWCTFEAYNSASCSTDVTFRVTTASHELCREGWMRSSLPSRMKSTSGCYIQNAITLFLIQHICVTYNTHAHRQHMFFKYYQIFCTTTCNYRFRQFKQPTSSTVRVCYYDDANNSIASYTKFIHDI